MTTTPDETAAPLASALVRAGRAGSGQRIALSNGTASASVMPLIGRRTFLGTLASVLAAPLELPSHFELIINLKNAKVLRLTIPPSLLLRADQVIE